MDIKFPFDECWLINLVERPDRKEYMIKQFENMGVLDQIKIHQAVKAPEWIYKIFCDSINEIINIPGDDFKGNMDVPQAINCWREHYTLIKSAYLRGLNSIMIIEDDCGFIKDEEILQNHLNNLPKDWGVLKLNCLRGVGTEKYINDYKSQYKYWFPQVNTLWGTGCYALSRVGMKYILDYYDVYFSSIDTPIAHQYKYNLLNDHNKIYNKVTPLDHNVTIYISEVPLGLCHDECSMKSDLHQKIYDEYKNRKDCIYYLHNYINGIDLNNYY